MVYQTQECHTGSTRIYPLMFAHQRVFLYTNLTVERLRFDCDVMCIKFALDEITQEIGNGSPFLPSQYFETGDIFTRQPQRDDRSPPVSHRITSHVTVYTVYYTSVKRRIICETPRPDGTNDKPRTRRGFSRSSGVTT